jgi:hypothetical protein
MNKMILTFSIIFNIVKKIKIFILDDNHFYFIIYS